MNESPIFVGLDIGTSRTCAVIGEHDVNGLLEIIGIGIAPNTGLRKGVVVNIEATLNSVKEAIQAAEFMAGRTVSSCLLGLAGAHIEGINSRGVVAVSGQNKEICKADVDRVIEAARAIVIPMDREVFHVIPQTFIVDDQKGIRDPIDMIGVRLEAEVHIITGSTTAKQNLIRCVNRAGFRVDACVLQTLATSTAVLSNDEKELGCLLIDFGCGTTDTLMFAEGAPFFSSTLDIGSSHITNDIALVLGVPIAQAEELKIKHGCCHFSYVDPEETIIIPGIAGHAPREIARTDLVKIIQPRAREIFEMIKDKIDANGYLRRIRGGIVITGGASVMLGVAELVSEVFGFPARIGSPSSLGGLSDAWKNPAYSTAVGLVLMGSSRVVATKKDQKVNPPDRGVPKSKKNKAIETLKWWFKEFF